MRRPDPFRVALILGGGAILVYVLVKLGPVTWFLP
jgi:hypothetical protein